MSRIAAVVFSFIISAALLDATPARSRELRGWDTYKFGMTIEQALAVPGTTVSSKEPYCGRKLRLRDACPPVMYWHLRSPSRAAFGLSNFAVELTFRARRLFQVALYNGETGTIGDCERRFEVVLLDFEHRHGSLSAGGLPVVLGPDVKPIRSLAKLGSSRYAQWTWDASLTEFIYTGAMSRWHVWSAEKVMGDRRVEIRATHELEYRFGDKEVFEFGTEGQFGACRINVELRLGAPRSSAYGPAGLVVNRAKAK